MTDVVKTSMAIFAMTSNLENVDCFIINRPIKRKCPLAAFLSYVSLTLHNSTLLLSKTMLRTKSGSHCLQRCQNVHLYIETVIWILPICRGQWDHLWRGFDHLLT